MKISDNQLLDNTLKLVEKERLTLNEILEHLAEIQKRRLYATLGYSSLFKYLVKELKYSEGAAARRISALKLVTKVPQAKSLIQTGELNLTNAYKLQVQSKAYNSEETLSLLEKVRNKTTQECEKELFYDRVERSGNKDLEYTIKVRIDLKEKTYRKLDRLKARTKIYDTATLIDHALSVALLQMDNAKISRRSRGSKNNRYIPALTRRKIYERANYMCEYPGCDEIHNLEIDHIKPYAKGGTNRFENLRVYCKTHNQRSAIESFGVTRMQKFLSSG